MVADDVVMSRFIHAILAEGNPSIVLWLQQLNLLSSDMQCPICNDAMSLQKRQKKTDGCVWFVYSLLINYVQLIKGWVVSGDRIGYHLKLTIVLCRICGFAKQVWSRLNDFLI